jgi:hypothetical protein
MYSSIAACTSVALDNVAYLLLTQVKAVLETHCGSSIMCLRVLKCYGLSAVSIIATPLSRLAQAQFHKHKFDSLVYILLPVCIYTTAATIYTAQHSQKKQTSS